MFSTEAVEKISTELWEKDYYGKRVRKHLYINMRGISLTNKKVEEGGIVSHRRRQYLCSLDLENICKKILWCQRSIFFLRRPKCVQITMKESCFFFYTNRCKWRDICSSIQTFNINCCLSSFQRLISFRSCANAHIRRVWSKIRRSVHIFERLTSLIP